LSRYEVIVPNWRGASGVRVPFKAWETGESLPSYDAYNTTKHDRQSEFEAATFEHLVDACCGMLCILSAQFCTFDYSTGPSFLILESGTPGGTDVAMGGFFRVRFPPASAWPIDLLYDFDWTLLEPMPNPFLEFDYASI
jgi:hypothetical protein